tara:strand:+ start:1491 stop:1802 length:312 start_codon:yes stop_codon:yes gene_type:complete
MSWKNVLKNYRPLAHDEKAHEKAIEEGKQAFIDKDNPQRNNIRGRPSSYPSPDSKYNERMNNYSTKQPRQQGIGMAETNPDGTPFTQEQKQQRLKEWMKSKSK